MSELIVHPVVLAGGLQDSKPTPEPSDLQILTNFTLFRGRYAVRAPFDLVASLTGATQVLALCYHNLKMFAVAYHGGTTETILWELDDDGGNPTNRGQIWSGTVPVPVLASIVGGTASVPVNRLYIADYGEQFATRFWNGTVMVTVQEDWDDDNDLDDIKFTLIAPFQYHLWGTGWWGLVGETIGPRPEVAYFSRPGLIAEDEPDAIYNTTREWFSYDYRPLGRRGDKFRNIGFVKNGMVMFKEYESYLVWGADADTWQGRVLSPKAGAIGPYASDMTGDGLCYFWAPGRGPHVTDGDAVVDISEDVRKRVLASRADETTVVVSSPTDGLVYFIYKELGDSYPQHWLAYDKAHKRWSEGEWLAYGGGIMAAGGGISVPELTLPGPAGPPSPPATKIHDTFTDTNGVHFDTHVADTGEAYYETGSPFFTIQSNRVDVPATSSQKIACQRTNGEQFVAGDEVWFEVQSPTSGHASQGGVGLWFMASVPANPPVTTQDHYVMFVEFHTSGLVDIDMGRYKSPSTYQYDQAVVDDMAWTNGTWKRIGCTINSIDSYTIWSEPAGGGTRTTLGTWSPTPAGDTYNYLGSSTHKYMGLYSTTTQFFSPHLLVDELELKGQSATGALVAEALDENRIDLTWTNGDQAGNTITEIYRDVTPNPTTKIGEVESGVEYYSDTTPSADTLYHYRVRHKRNGQYSGYSNDASAKSFLAKPTSVTLTGIDTGIQIGFNNNADGADIEVWRRRNVEPGYSRIATMSAQSLGAKTYDDTTATCSFFYFYFLKAVKTGSTNSKVTSPIGLRACRTPELQTCEHALQLDYYDNCHSRCVVAWVGDELMGNYIRIKRNLQDDPYGANYVVATVDALVGVYNDGLLFITASGEAARTLSYTLELLEGSASGPVIDSCTTSTSNPQFSFCAE